jgi:hypothetical protein
MVCVSNQQVCEQRMRMLYVDVLHNCNDKLQATILLLLLLPLRLLLQLQVQLPVQVAMLILLVLLLL